MYCIPIYPSTKKGSVIVTLPGGCEWSGGVQSRGAASHVSRQHSGGAATLAAPHHALQECDARPSGAGLLTLLQGILLKNIQRKLLGLFRVKLCYCIIEHRLKIPFKSISIS